MSPPVARDGEDLSVVAEAHQVVEGDEAELSRMRRDAGDHDPAWLEERGESFSQCRFVPRTRAESGRRFCALLHQLDQRINGDRLAFAQQQWIHVDTLDVVAFGTQLAEADEHVAIPMHGHGSSLTVSVVVGIILFEAERQRRAAGLYDQSRLTPDERARTLFEWSYPDIAERCRALGKPYPELTADGMIAANPLIDISTVSAQE